MAQVGNKKSDSPYPVENLIGGDGIRYDGKINAAKTS